MPSEAEYQAQISELRLRLEEATHTLDAIQSGTVDAVVVNGPNGSRVYTLESPDQPFQTLVECMQEGALTLSADGAILYANGFLSTLLQRPMSQLLGTRFAALVLPSYRETAVRLVERGFTATVKETLRLLLPEGSVPVQVTLSPLAGAEQPTCCGVVVDLREREEAEQARIGREAAEHANAAKDRFLAVLGHELRSPLNTVLGWSQILAKRPDLDPLVQKAVKAIERNARSQAQLISELLDVSRIISGKLHLEFEVVDLKGIVLATVAASKLNQEKNVDVHCVLPEGPAPVLGDATRLQQIVTNLLGNALKFTDEGGRVTLTLTADDRQIELAVADTGSGIDPSQIDVIFEVYKQVSVQSQRKGGLGLGLSISKQLAEAHGGQIRVHSLGPGQGATFTVQLPRAREPLVKNEEQQFVDSQLAKRRILVIDDDADILDLMRYALEHRGALVDTVQSAAAALDRLAEQRYDVLISDLGLPEQDGLALMREIRARGNLTPSLRAVALTGYASEADARLCASVGFELHLVKPISPWELARAITRLLEQKAPPALSLSQSA